MATFRGTVTGRRSASRVGYAQDGLVVTANTQKAGVRVMCVQTRDTKENIFLIEMTCGENVNSLDGPVTLLRIREADIVALLSDEQFLSLEITASTCGCHYRLKE